MAIRLRDSKTNMEDGIQLPTRKSGEKMFGIAEAVREGVKEEAKLINMGKWKVVIFL